MAEKLFYSMGEVSEMFDVRPSLLRHWETQFPMLRPKRNKKGNRLYSPQDVEHLKSIYHLVKERGMTLEGDCKAMRQQRADKGVSRDAELMERLQRIRALLLEVREDLKDDGDEAVVRPQPEIEESEPATAAPEHAQTPAAAPAAEFTAAAEPEEAPASDTEKPAAPAAETPATPAAEAPAAAPAAEESTPTKRRRPRRKKDEAENKELFAFYEQSLF